MKKLPVQFENDNFCYAGDENNQQNIAVNLFIQVLCKAVSRFSLKQKENFNESILLNTKTKL